MKTAFALFTLLFAVPVSAATRIDVIGTFDTAALETVSLHQPNEMPGLVIDPIALTNYTLFSETSGSAIFDNGTYSDCTGLMYLFCSTYLTGPGLFAGGISEIMEITPTTLYYANDGDLRPFEWQGETFLGFQGMVATGTVTYLAYSEVPLPAGGVLLLTALGLIGWRLRAA